MTAPIRSDLSAWPRRLKTLTAAFVGFGGLGVMVVLGAPLLGVSGPVVHAWLNRFADGPLGLMAVIGAFTVLAFVGAPQFVLIAAVVEAFGPWRGAAYSWIGTLISAGLGFGIGRRFAGGLLGVMERPGLRRFAGLVSRNGFIASLIVRLVPAAPFVLINVAAGALPITTTDFAAGTAVGVIPKIAVTALGAEGVGRADGPAGGWIAAAVLLWLGTGLAARAWLRRWERASASR